MIRMLESVYNNLEVHIEEISDDGQGLGDHASNHVPSNFGQMPPIPAELTNDIGDPNYWQALVTELMKWIPQVPTETPYTVDKLAYRVAQHNPKVFYGIYIPVVLDE